MLCWLYGTLIELDRGACSIAEVFEWLTLVQHVQLGLSHLLNIAKISTTLCQTSMHGTWFLSILFLLIRQFFLTREKEEEDHFNFV